MIMNHRQIIPNLTYASIFKDYEEFKLKTGLDEDEHQKALFYIFLIKNGDTQTKWKSLGYAIGNIAFYIELGANQLAEAIKQKTDGHLIGSWNDINNYIVGDLQESGEDFDKYKTSRSTQESTNDKYLSLVQMLSLDTSVEIIYNRLYPKIFNLFNITKTKRRKLW